MLNAGIDKVYRDTILGHSFEGMDAHYIAPTEETLIQVMAKYTDWLDRKAEDVFANVDQKQNKQITNS
jgi:hypothetical protein